MPNDQQLYGSIIKEMLSKIKMYLENPQTTLDHASDWFKVINQHPPDGFPAYMECHKEIVQ
jgi:hypothetical protein